MSSTLHAGTLFGSLRTVEDRLSELLRADSYIDVDVFAVADEATSALAELGDALLEVAPFPSVTRTGVATDGSVGAFLESRYVEDDGVDVDLSTDERVLERQGSVVVPLERTGPAVRNWRPTLAVLGRFVEDLLTRAETVLRRVRTVDATHVRDACRAVHGMLASVRDVLVRSVSGSRFVDRRSNQGAETTIEFAKWAGDQLTGGNDA